MLLGTLLPLALLHALDVATAPAGDFFVAVVFAVAKPLVAIVIVVIAVVSIFGRGLLYGCLAFDDFKLVFTVIFCQLVVSHIYAPRGMP